MNCGRWRRRAGAEIAGESTSARYGPILPPDRQGKLEEIAGAAASVSDGFNSVSSHDRLARPNSVQTSKRVVHARAVTDATQLILDISAWPTSAPRRGQFSGTAQLE